MAALPSSFAPESVESKLLEVDSDLAAQEAQLAAELQALREKRKSLHTVIDLFSADPTPPSAATNASSSPETEAIADPEASVSKTTFDAKEPPNRRGRQPGRKAAATKASPPPETPARSSARRQSRQSDEWEAYLKPDYQDLTVAQAVLSVLEQYPDDVVKVPHIMDSILRDSTPKDVRSTLRHRLSNVLTVGLKKEKWYRGGTGTYSVSKAAAEASMT